MWKVTLLKKKKRKETLSLFLLLYWTCLYCSQRDVKRRRRRRSRQLPVPAKGVTCKKWRRKLLASIIFRHFLFLKDTVDFDSDGILRLRHRDPDTDEEKKYVASLGREIFRVHEIKCNKGHIMEYTNMNLVAIPIVFYRCGYSCDVCSCEYSIGFHSHYCLHCVRCNYDICISCAKKKLSRTANVIAYPYEFENLPSRY